MWFAIIGEDVERSAELRKTFRPAHLARLESLQAEDRVLVAGPLPVNETNDDEGFSGTLMVVDFPNLAAAEAWAVSDPYVTGGVFKSVSVKPFKKAIP